MADKSNPVDAGHVDCGNEVEQDFVRRSMLTMDLVFAEDGLEAPRGPYFPSDKKGMKMDDSTIMEVI